jgi:hypothetical protein
MVPGTNEVCTLSQLPSRFTRPLFCSVSACLIAVFGFFQLAPISAQQATAPPDFSAFLRKFQPGPADFDDHTGWVQIFDGKTLDGWKGNPEIWHVADGAIIGESSPDKPSGTTNIFYTKAQPGNFMLKMEIKLEGAGANGGVQYRSQNVPPKPFEMPQGVPDAQRKQLEQMRQAQEPLIKRNAPWNMAGYQLDLDYGNMFSGQLYEQDSKRFIVTFPGTFVEAHEGGKNLVATLGPPEEFGSYVKPGEWNQVEIIADGHLLVHLINGHIMSMTLDNDPTHFSPNGLIGFEIEGPGVITISHRNVWLKNLQ